MRAQNYRPKVHPGVIARGRSTSSTASSSGAPHRSRNAVRATRRKSEKRGQGARVIWLLMIIGGLIAVGFVLAQRSQINAHQFRQAEEKVKTQLDELANQQRFLALQKERAINTQESDRIAKQSGLIQPRMSKGNQAVAAAATAKPVTAKPAAANKPVAKPAVKPAAAPAGKAAVKSAPKPALQLAKLPAKPATAQAGKNKAVPPGKAGKDGKNPSQLAQRQDAKKEKRR